MDKEMNGEEEDVCGEKEKWESGFTLRPSFADVTHQKTLTHQRETSVADSAQ